MIPHKKRRNHHRKKATRTEKAEGRQTKEKTAKKKTHTNTQRGGKEMCALGGHQVKTRGVSGGKKEKGLGKVKKGLEEKPTRGGKKSPSFTRRKRKPDL